MNIAILANQQQLQEFEKYYSKPAIQTTITNDMANLKGSYDAVFDFLYDNNLDRILQLQNLKTLVFVNSVTNILDDSTKNFVRFNGWQTMIKRDLWEIAITENNEYYTILNALQINYVKVPNIVGLLTPRVISMLVNEAYFALGEGVSTKKEIDIAMKLGTNYPYGPFEWSEIIGLKNIVTLLQTLQINDARYTVANAMLTGYNIK